MGVGAMYVAHIVWSFIEGPGCSGGIGGCFTLLLVLLVPLGVWILGVAIWGKEQGTLMENRTQRADTIARQLKNGESAPSFACYLRPFDTTGRLLVRNAAKILGSGWDMSKPDYVELETLLADITAEWETELVAIGRPDEHVGAGRIAVTDEEWKELAALLVRHAGVIYMVPGSTEGTLWEMRHLLERGSLGRTIFVMPPANARVPVLASTSALPISEAWERARTAAAEFGLTLPAYSVDGKFLILRDDGTVEAERTIGEYYSFDFLKQSILELHGHLTRHPRSLARSI